MQWKENELGLLVPATPYTYGSKTPQLNRLRKVLGEKYLLAPSRRQIMSSGQKVPADLGPWDLQHIREHVSGRKEESVKVLLGVALLRKKGIVERDDVVAYKGAQYQRGKGSTDYPAAHRFPCNPTIRGWGLPHHARTSGDMPTHSTPLSHWQMPTLRALTCWTRLYCSMSTTRGFQGRARRKLRKALRWFVLRCPMLQAFLSPMGSPVCSRRLR